MFTNGAPHDSKARDLIDALRQAKNKVARAEAGVILDFSSVRRIPPSVLKHLQELSSVAESTKSKVILRGVTVDVYKVLKLLKVSSHFSFVDCDS